MPRLLTLTRLAAIAFSALLATTTVPTALAQSSLPLRSSSTQDTARPTDSPLAGEENTPPPAAGTQIADGDPFASWGIPTPPGAEDYQVNSATEDELNPQGLDQWHPTINPNDEIVAGQMRSDHQDVPAEFTKADADKAETTEADLQADDTPSLQAADGCSVYWPSWFEVCGAIKTLYDNIGGPTSFLNLPKSNELTNPDGVGKRSEFVNGFIYWHPTSGAHTVSIPVSKVWQRHGWEQGFLGYPITNDITLSNQWYVQHFQGGHVYTHNALPASQASIQGAIYDKWQSMGAHNSELGYPISDELTTPDGIGRYNVFEGGMIYWTPQHGAHPVTKPILVDWAAIGYEKSAYGYPIEDPYEEGDFVYQRFQGGMIESAKINALMESVSTPYLEFPSAKLAAEFFDRVEAGLESISQPDVSSLQATAKRYGPCELALDYPHRRKSSNFEVVGFKPVTSCSEKVVSVTHASTLRYKFYHSWKQAPDISNQIDDNPDYAFVKNAKSGLNHQYRTFNMAQTCEGDVTTSFIGVTEGTIVTSSGTYYARAYSKLVRIDCEIPDDRRW